MWDNMWRFKYTEGQNNMSDRQYRVKTLAMHTSRDTHDSGIAQGMMGARPS